MGGGGYKRQLSVKISVLCQLIDDEKSKDYCKADTTYYCF